MARGVPTLKSADEIPVSELTQGYISPPPIMYFYVHDDEDWGRFHEKIRLTRALIPADIHAGTGFPLLLKKEQLRTDRERPNFFDIAASASEECEIRVRFCSWDLYVAGFWNGVEWFELNHKERLILNSQMLANVNENYCDLAKLGRKLMSVPLGRPALIAAVQTLHRARNKSDEAIASAIQIICLTFAECFRLDTLCLDRWKGYDVHRLTVEDTNLLHNWQSMATYVLDGLDDVKIWNKCNISDARAEKIRLLKFKERNREVI